MGVSRHDPISQCYLISFHHLISSILHHYADILQFDSIPRLGIEHVMALSHTYNSNTDGQGKFPARRSDPAITPQWTRPRTGSLDRS